MFHCHQPFPSRHILENLQTYVERVAISVNAIVAILHFSCKGLGLLDACSCDWNVCCCSSNTARQIHSTRICRFPSWHSTCNANCSVELVQHAARRERLNPTSQVVRGASPHQQSKVPKKAESMNCHHIYEELRGTPFQEGQEWRLVCVHEFSRNVHSFSWILELQICSNSTHPDLLTFQPDLAR